MNKKKLPPAMNIKNKPLAFPKLQDANEAGGKSSSECTLILVEGDSAQKFAMAGINAVRKDFYGVFPLKGKLLNVRKADTWIIMKNEEIKHVMGILGLNYKETYANEKSRESLRYGHLMILTDQDHDGSHIKGLIISFIHQFWPLLLERVPTFLSTFITPIIKATHVNGDLKSFFSIPAFEKWEKGLGGDRKNWTTKYFKGLAGSDRKEAMDYFENIDKYQKYFTWKGDEDRDAIDIAFSKHKVQERKEWIQKFEAGTYLDYEEQESPSYKDFVDKEFILYALADLQRYIPSMLDGLKPVHRKILYSAFKEDVVREIPLSEFMGHILEHTAYHHGLDSLAGAIVRMAQDDVGSNNINLFNSGGQFGMRHEGGEEGDKDPAYLYTNLTPIARTIFSKDDDIILDYKKNENGKPIEPFWYAPVIPLILVNGCRGIGTGFSTEVPKHNPRSLCAYFICLLNNEKPTVPIAPWYKGISPRTTKENEKSFKDCKLQTGKKVTRQNMKKPSKEEELLMKKFKLKTSTSNMYLFDTQGVLKKYKNPEQILDEFYDFRLELYSKRKEMLLPCLQLELVKLEYIQKFIDGADNDVFTVWKRKDVLDYLNTTLEETKENSSSEATLHLYQENDERFCRFYRDLLSSMPMNHTDLTQEEKLENQVELNSQKTELNRKIKELTHSDPKQLWLNDLTALDKKLEELGVY